MSEECPSPWPAALAWGVLAAGLVGLVQYAYVRGHGGQWSALVRVGKTSNLRPLIEADLGPVPRAPDVGHDGQIMYLLARHTFTSAGRPVLQESLDHPEYRARRILYPALAGGGGLLPPSAIVAGLVGWSLVGAFLYGMGVGLLGSVWRLPALPQCIAILNPGLISAGLILGCDALALGLATLAVALWLRGHAFLAVTALTAAALTKDTFILFAVVLAVIELRQRCWRTAMLVVLVPAIPLALWAAWVHVHFQQEVAQGAFNFAWPGQGLVEAFPAWQGLSGEQRVQLFMALGMLIAGIVSLWLARQPVAFGMLAVYVALGLITSSAVWQAPNNAVRVLAPLWTFAPLVLLPQRVAGRLGNRAGDIDDHAAG
jgi:hypothetical protein